LLIFSCNQYTLFSFLSEKWLPYKSIKRPVIVQKVKQSSPQPPPKNVIIEYEKPKAVAIRQVIEEGVFRVDPIAYQACHSSDAGEIRFVDRIIDLPIESSRILAQLNLDAVKSTSTGDKDEACGGYYAQLLSSANSSSNESTSRLQSAHSVPNLLEVGNSNYYTQPNSCLSNDLNNSNSDSRKTSSNQHNHRHHNHNIQLPSHHHQQYYQSSGTSNVEYETITTSVPESLATKIIAEAQAAGAITRNIRSLNNF
jgi:hypothetical protein